MSEHEELEISIAAWVLGAVEGGEADALRAHIETCPICTATALRLGRAVDALPLEVEEVAPPTRLRERILAAAAASRGEAVVPIRTRATEHREPLRAKASQALSSRMQMYAAAAAVIIALAVGLVAGDLIGRGAPTPSPVSRATLVGHEALAGARANVIDLKNEGVALVDFSGLPQPESGKVYEIWLITADGRADPAGVFVPDSNGSRFVLVSRSVAGYKVMAVTSEAGPAGTLAPTQQPQLYGNLA